MRRRARKMEPIGGRAATGRPGPGQYFTTPRSRAYFTDRPFHDTLSPPKRFIEGFDELIDVGVFRILRALELVRDSALRHFTASLMTTRIFGLTPS